VAAWAVDARPIEDLAAEADEGDRERIDRDLEREDDAPLWVQADHRRGPTGRALGCGPLLGHEVRGGQFSDEAADGAPGESGRGDEFGSGGGAACVQFANDGTEVRSANGLAALPDGFQTHRHVICVPLVQML